LKLNDPDLVRAAYESECGLAARAAVYNRVSSSIRYKHVAGSVPDLAAPLHARRSVALFVEDTS
jgi:hypothetical protein